MGQRVVFNAGGKPRMKPVRESVSPLGAINLVRNNSNAVSPFEIIFFCPAHGAAFSRSKRSARYGGNLSSFFPLAVPRLLSRSKHRINLFLQVRMVNDT